MTSGVQPSTAAPTDHDCGESCGHPDCVSPACGDACEGISDED